jgi:hypothetical protein
VRLLTDAGMDWTINWLIDNNVEIWLNDSWAKLCAWSDVDENDNTGVGRLTSVIDEIKKQTKITEQFITTAHTGRAKQAEGDERARGSDSARRLGGLTDGADAGGRESLPLRGGTRQGRDAEDEADL